MMPKRLTEDARRLVLTGAGDEARRRGDRRLGTAHLLLGLLHDEDSPAARALGVSLAGARAALDSLDAAALSAVGVEVRGLAEGPAAPFGRRRLPLTSGARTVFKLAVGQARPFQGGIGTQHFLLALLALRRPDPAADLLHALGADLAAVRARLAAPPSGEAA
jgi:ATP-dependent Clp protease ATP-binding subunit ClpA